MIVGAKPKEEVSTYSGSFYGEEVTDWINEFAKYFKFKRVTKGKRVNFAATGLYNIFNRRTKEE